VTDPKTGFQVRLVRQSDAGPYWAWLLGPGGIEENYVACLEKDSMLGPYSDMEVARRRFEFLLDPYYVAPD